MVKKNIIIIFIITIYSCGSLFYNKTIFGKIRIKKSRFTVGSNLDEAVYKKIDTNSIYKFSFEEKKNITGSPHYIFYKFYSKGKVALFYCNDFDKPYNVIDSRKGEMGYFSYDGNNIIVETSVYTMHFGLGLDKKTFKIKDDEIIHLSEDPLYNAYIKTVYKKEKISKGVKIINPDW